MQHLMIDIETISVQKTAGIWAVGIQPFEFGKAGIAPVGTGHLVYTDPAEQKRLFDMGKVHASNDTISWSYSHGDRMNFQPWHKVFIGEGEQIDFGLAERPIMPVLSVRALHEFIKDITEDGALFWAKGKEFDLAILEYQFSLFNLPTPWHYRNAMCMRSLDGLVRALGGERVQPEASHNALEDAQAQVKVMGKLVDEMRPLLRDFGFGAVTLEAGKHTTGATGLYEGRASRQYPHVNAAFINAIAEEGTKDEAIRFLQAQWNETCYLRGELVLRNNQVDALRRAFHEGPEALREMTKKIIAT